MASSSKKAHRPAVKQERPLPAALSELATAPASDISASALQAAEALPPVETPVAEAAAPLAAAVVEPPVPLLAEEAAPALAEEPAPLLAEEAPASEAVVPPAPVLTDETPAAAPQPGDNVRALFEKGLVESRAKFGQAKTVAEEASAAVEASFGAARDGLVALNVKTIEALKVGVDANLELFASLAAAKSISELVSLQSEFARKRFEETSSQAKAFADLARKVADDAAAPIKAHVTKAFKVAV